MGQNYIRGIASLYDRITFKDLQNRNDNVIITTNQNKITFGQLTLTNIYEELLFQNYRDHHSSPKWLGYFNKHIDWDPLWQTVHNPLATENTKTLIWEQ